MCGATESLLDLGRLELADGRFVSNLDIRRFWSVVGADVAARIRQSGAREVVGASLDIGGHIFTLAGELNRAADSYGMPVQIEANEAVFVPITTARRMNPERGIKEIVARAVPGVFHEDAVSGATAWFGQRLGEEVKFEVKSAKQLIEQMESQLGLMTLLLGAVGSISLIVGGIVGTAFGTVATWAICRFTEWEFFVSELSIVVGLGVSSAVGIFFGYQPAHQAARLDPIVALQGE